MEVEWRALRKTMSVGCVLGLLVLFYFSLPSLLLESKHYRVILTLFPNSQQAPAALSGLAHDADSSIGQLGANYTYIAHGMRGSSGQAYTNQQRQTALTYLERLLKDYPTSTYANIAEGDLAHLYFDAGNYDQARPLLEDVLKRYPFDRGSNQTLLDIIDSTAPVPASKVLLSGTVYLGDQPEPNVYVFLRPKNTTNALAVPPFSAYPVVKTDANGHYRFTVVRPDTYDVGVGAPTQQVAGYTLPDAPDYVIVGGANHPTYDVHLMAKG